MPRSKQAIVGASLVVATLALPAFAADIASDPMRPDTLQSAPTAAPARYRVNAIIVSDERRIAIVNGRRVGVGDAIGDATVVAIGKAEVTVNVNGSERTLRVNNGAGQ